MTIDTASDLYYADTLWKTADALRGQVDAAEYKHVGEFYTPRSVARVLVEMLEPYAGRAYDPACDSGGMFVQSEKFFEASRRRVGEIAVYNLPHVRPLRQRPLQRSSASHDTL
jgi:type I restriction-modification system DNA methylase subunit